MSRFFKKKMRLAYRGKALGKLMLEHSDMFFERRVTAGWANLAHLMHISVPEVADWAVAALGAL